MSLPVDHYKKMYPNLNVSHGPKLAQLLLPCFPTREMYGLAAPDLRVVREKG